MFNSLGERMKDYESISKNYLIRKTPVIIRVDGKSFHTFTRGMNRPYDNILSDSMRSTALDLAKNIQGCKLGYTQSDEISLLLTDYESIKTEPFFNYNVQKICSVVASMTTLYFNINYRANVLYEEASNKEIDEQILYNYNSKIDLALFDCRCFNIPKEEVENYFIWRQEDATRNSIQMLGQANFSHKKLQNISCNKIQDMLMTEKNINFNDVPIKFKRGSSIIQKDVEYNSSYIKKIWFIEDNTPIFTQNREFITKLVYPTS